MWKLAVVYGTSRNRLPQGDDCARDYAETGWPHDARSINCGLPASVVILVIAVVPICHFYQRRRDLAQQHLDDRRELALLSCTQFDIVLRN